MNNNNNNIKVNLIFYITARKLSRSSPSNTSKKTKLIYKYFNNTNKDKCNNKYNHTTINTIYLTVSAL